MKDVFKTFNSGRANFFLLAFIACVIGGAVLKLTASMVVPLAIAILLAFVMYPLVLGLDKLRMPRFLSILLVVLIIAAGLYLFALVLFSSARAIFSLYPKYETRLTEIYLWVSRYFELSYDEDLTFFQNLWGQLGVRTLVRDYTLSFSNIFFRFLKDAVIMVLFLVFILVEASHFREKLDTAFGEKTAMPIKQIGADVMLQVTRYLVAKFLISLLTGLVVAVGLGFVGLEFALVWGVLQFIMNFIPSLGSIAVGVAVSLFGLIQFWPEPGPVIAVVAIVLGANQIIGNVLDPKIIGDNVGLSTLVVLIALGFWGFIWGFAGMIMAVPMMVIIKIVCEHVPFLEPVSILLGSRKSALKKKPQEAGEQKADS